MSTPEEFAQPKLNTSDAPPDPAAKAIKAPPYQPDYRHQCWFVHIRYTTCAAAAVGHAEQLAFQLIG